MLELLADFYPEGIGSEVVLLAGIILVLTIIYFAWLTTGFPPLNYEVFMVELQTWNNQHLVQILHVGLEDVRQFSGDLVRRIRAAGNRLRPSNNEATSDINILVQTPETVIEGENIESPSSDQMRLYQVQMPVRSQTQTQNQSDTDEPRSEAGLSEREMTVLTTIAFVSGRMNSLGEGSSQTTRIESDETTRVVNDGNAILIGEGPLPQEGNTSNESSNEEVSDGNEGTEKAEDEVSSDDSNEQIETEKPNTMIKLKYLDDTIVEARTFFNRSVGDFKKEFFASDIAEGKVVRLIYQGQLLSDDTRSLTSYRVEDQCIVHCYVTEGPKPPTQTTRGQRNPTGPSVPVSTDAPPRQRPTFMESFNHFAEHFPLAAFQTESMAAAVQGFFEAPVPPNNTPNAMSRNRGFFANLSQRFENAHNAFETHVYEAEEETAQRAAAYHAANPPNPNPTNFRIEIGDLFLWILAVQLVAVWIFWWMYPQFCDNFAFYLLVFFTAYFIYIMCRHHVPPAPSN